MNKMLLSVVCGLFLAACNSSHAQIAISKEMWFNPSSDYANRWPGKDADYQQMFQDTSGWATTFSAISTFGIGEYFARTGPTAELSSVLSFLNTHQIHLFVMFPVVNGWQTGCGAGVEGVNHDQGDILAEAQNVQANGGTIDYIVMDEPLAFGHYYSGDGACNYTIAQVAKQASYNLKTILSVFPNAKIIDTEPLLSTGGNPADIQRWYLDLQADLGRQVDMVTFDVPWNATGWPALAQNYLDVIGMWSLPYNLIADGTLQDTSGAQWNGEAQHHLHGWATKVIAPPPNAVLIESWDQYPFYILPESDSNSLSWLSAWYAQTAGLPALR